MQHVLSIDLTLEPARFVVVGIEGRKVEVVEAHSFPMGDWVRGTRGVLMNGARDTGASLNGSGAHPSGETETEVLRPFDVIRSIKTPWINSVVTIPAYSYLSLNLELPFNSPKNVNKILDMEVQDVVPFDVGDFLLEHRALTQLENGSYDIHVSLIPKLVMQELLARCHASDFEPFMVTTAASAMAGLYHLAPDYFGSDSAIVFGREPLYSVTTRVAGTVRSDRVINRGLLDVKAGAPVESPEGAKRALLTELKLSLASAERRYKKTIENVYVADSPFRGVELQQALGRTTSSIQIQEFVKVTDERDSLAALAAVFAQDLQAPPVLSNFRVREFSYRPQLREILQGARALLPLVIAALVLAVVALVTVYTMRETRISRLRDAVARHIRQVVPAGKLQEGSEIASLQGEIKALQDQLRNLRAPSTLSPIDYLAEISEDVGAVKETTGSNIAISSIRITASSVTVEGTSPNYEDVEKLEAALNKKPKIYCKVLKKPTSSGGVGSTVGFRFDLTLCD